MSSERESTHQLVELITDPDEKARAEARNGLLQFDYTLKLIDAAIVSGKPARLRPSIIIEMNRLAIVGIEAGGGAYRNGAVFISHSKDTPPPPHQGTAPLEKKCDYLEKNTHPSATHF